MKKKIHYSLLIILTTCIVCISCKKEKTISPVFTPPPSQPVSPDTLTGREFLYANLIWQTIGEPYVQIPGSRLFLNREIKVFIDSSSSWINVPFYSVEFGFGTAIPFPVNNGYIYDNTYFDSVFVFAIDPNNTQLIGTPVSVKIKIL